MNICKVGNCTGCCACLNTCPQRCISMVEDEFGEIHPIIDETRCSKCNLCIRNCPINNKSNFQEIKKCYASWNLDAKDRSTSGSGGVATVFGNTMVDLGGIVFGAKYDKDLKIVHSKAVNKDSVQAFKGSKYAHSYIGNCYLEIKNRLRDRGSVLFVGTPCQVDGLNFYLGKEHDNLITVDLVCHGVPPGKYLKEYIDHLKIKENIKASQVRFRGENDFVFTVLDGENITYTKPNNSDLYYYGFTEGIFNRNNCYSCKYAQRNRISDITIGDFWGLGKEKPFDAKINRPSEILITTSKGMDFFDKCKSKLFYEERPIEEAIKGNGQLQHPLERHIKTDKFRENYKKYGFVEASQKSGIIFDMKTRKLRIEIRNTKLLTRKIIKKIIKY